MGKSKHYEYGSGDTNPETTDQAAESGSDHNEAQAQKPEGTLPAETLTAGQQTTTTPDSLRGDTVEAQSVNEIDQRDPGTIQQQLRGWQRRVAQTGPKQADWEDFNKILQSDEAGAVRRP